MSPWKSMLRPNIVILTHTMTYRHRALLRYFLFSDLREPRLDTFEHRSLNNQYSHTFIRTLHKLQCYALHCCVPVWIISNCLVHIYIFHSFEKSVEFCCSAEKIKLYQTLCHNLSALKFLYQTIFNGLWITIRRLTIIHMIIICNCILRFNLWTNISYITIFVWSFSVKHLNWLN